MGSWEIAGTISSIDVDRPQTWEDKIYLTFDIDWAHDEILQDTIEIVEAAGVSATWYITHDTQLLGLLRANPKFELGVHPNFNFLLQGDHRLGSTPEEVIDRVLEIVPEAKSVRSHSMTQSTRLLDLFKGKGLTHDCNHFIPHQADICLKPWRFWNGLTRVPYFWEDDGTCIYDQHSPMAKVVKRPGLKVFDFHPIHIYLNTESMERYESSRSSHQNPDQLIAHRGSHPMGTRIQLKELLGDRS